MDELITAVKRHPALSRKTSYQHWSHDQVRWSDTDLVGHLNNLAFGAFCETGRCLFFKPFLGQDPERRAMMLPVQLVVNFMAEAHWPEQVEIGTAILSIGKTSCRIGQGLFIGERCIGTSEVTAVLIDETTRKAVDVTTKPWLVDYLTRYLITP